MAFNIMVVDDSETMRSVVKRVVEMSGVPVGEFYEAADGRQALAIVEKEWVDVILSDINMPEMGGMELLKEIVSNDDFKRIPVIFITTESSAARMDAADKLGVAGYVTKPFVPETIKAVLLDVLEKAYKVKREDLVQEIGDVQDDNFDF
ncbi:MAG: response regulator [Proteobacteria bacterium]|nr:response regulator [Pseudomonadota bacterium]MBU1715809.1 response regulator [Pseudomonadota bacterium]